MQDGKQEFTKARLPMVEKPPYNVRIKSVAYNSTSGAMTLETTQLQEESTISLDSLLQQ